MLINTDHIYTILTPLFGLSSILLTIKTFIVDTVPQISPPSSDMSVAGIIATIIAACITSLMRVTNSVKAIEETNSKILITQNDLLKVQNDLLKALNEDSVKQEKILEYQGKVLEIESKILELMSNTKKRKFWK